MICAPITVAEARLDPLSRNLANAPILPPLFVANINGCITMEGMVIRLPKPESFMEPIRQAKKHPEESGSIYVGIPRFSGSAASKCQTGYSNSSHP
jgi:hypothetical protein